METLKAIQSRHSYRGKFTSASVSREDMREILEAAGDIAQYTRNTEFNLRL